MTDYWTVWAFPVPAEGGGVALPEHSTILGVGAEDGRPCVYVRLVLTEKDIPKFPLRRRSVVAVQTDEKVPSLGFVYHGSATVRTLVTYGANTDEVATTWHVFES